MMNKLLSGVFILLFYAACTRPQKMTPQGAGNYSFEIVDSLDLAILGNPMLAGVSQTAGRFAFYDFPSREFVFTDPSGGIVGRFSKKEDTPDAYGFLMEFPCFLSDNQVALVGMQGVFIYDLQGNMVSKMAHPETLSGAGFMAFPGKGMKTLMLEGRPYLISKSVRTRSTFPGEQAFYDRFRALELIDIEGAHFWEIVPFEEGSQFLDGNGYYESDYAPAYEVVETKLYVALGGEDRLQVYSLHPTGASLDTLIDLQIPDFGKLPVTPRESFSEGTIMINGGTPAIRNIHRVGGTLAIHYYGGISEETTKGLEALWLSGEEEEAERQYQQAEREVKQGVVLFDLTTMKVDGMLDFPEGTNYSGFASAGGYLWMERFPGEDVEEDFIRVYKVKLSAN
ncbi:hypothetical protein [Lunatimonas salinarum]|uniref:hypothetical protein n=1 Tax=Lunatimonas salinarum TaxID=1774590 RepID=UPI001FD7EF6B|nr:hypothetical protein [Lunatimonas salinarum]